MIFGNPTFRLKEGKLIITGWRNMYPFSEIGDGLECEGTTIVGNNVVGGNGGERE